MFLPFSVSSLKVPSRYLPSSVNATALSCFPPEAAVGHLLEIKLKEFGVEVTVDSIHPGPVITRYEIQPDAFKVTSRLSHGVSDNSTTRAPM